MKHQENTCAERSRSTYLAKFSEWLAIKGNAPKTVKGYTKSAGRFLEWLTNENIEPVHASYADVLAYINHQKSKGNNARSLQIISMILTRFYNCLQQNEEVSENPASNVTIKGIKRKTFHEIFTTEELEQLYRKHGELMTKEPEKSKRIMESYTNTRNNILVRKMNRVIVGLLIYQGITNNELEELEIKDLQLKEGKISIQAGRRSGARVMKLESHQLYDLMDYIHTTRKEILESTGKQSSKVFISVGDAPTLASAMKRVALELKSINPKLEDLKHIRTCVITNWLKTYNLRQVQYMAGHRYVSSTESYQQNNIEELQDDIRKYHPIS